MGSIKYVKGDATNPQGLENKLIVHICNDIGGWGKGFVLAISKKWKEPEKEYRRWFESKIDFELGKVQIVQVEANIFVANMIGQHKIREVNGIPPIRYQSVEECLNNVVDFAIKNQASIHMPRIGCGLAGGSWSEIEKIVNRTLIDNNIEVTVYDFN